MENIELLLTRITVLQRDVTSQHIAIRALLAHAPEALSDFQERIKHTQDMLEAQAATDEQIAEIVATLRSLLPPPRQV